MSGPKCAAYQVVSAAELLKRRLVASQARFDRLQDEAGLLAAEMIGARAAYGVSVDAPVLVKPPRSKDPVEWDSVNDSLQDSILRARQQLSAETRNARITQLQDLFKELPSIVISDDRQDHAVSPIKPQSQELLDKFLNRIPDTASDEEIRAVRDFVASASESNFAQVELKIRYEIQSLNDRDRRIKRNKKTLDGLIARLDGLDGDEAAQLRGCIRGADPSEDLNDDVSEAVESECARQGQVMDDYFVQDAATRVLTDLGYKVGGDFITAVPRDGALLDLPDSNQHAVRVRLRDGRLFFNVVRFDNMGKRNPPNDVRAEERFCRDFDRFKQEMSHRGVQLDMMRAEPPGKIPLEVLAYRSVSNGTFHLQEESPLERTRTTDEH